MRDFIREKIYELQKRINELQELKKSIVDSADGARFIIQTKHWYGWEEDMCLLKKKTRLDLSRDTLLTLIDNTIHNQKCAIDSYLECEMNSRKPGD